MLPTTSSLCATPQKILMMARRMKICKTVFNEKMTDSKRHYLLLDEAQEVAGWENDVNSLLKDANTDIYVTGSNSKLMSSEISTYPSGSSAHNGTLGNLHKSRLLGSRQTYSINKTPYSTKCFKEDSILYV